MLNCHQFTFSELLRRSCLMYEFLTISHVISILTLPLSRFLIGTCDLLRFNEKEIVNIQIKTICLPLIFTSNTNTDPPF